MSRGPPGSGLQERPPSAASTCESARPRRPRAGRPTASRPTCATPSASRACWPRGELSFARVPTVEEERFRDLVRAREDLRRDLMRARHRLSKLLLRREIRYPGKGRAWTRTHMDWLALVRLRGRALGERLLRLPRRGRAALAAALDPERDDRAPLAPKPPSRD